MINKSRLRWFRHVNIKVIITGSNVVSCGKLKELERTPEKDLMGLC